MFLAIDVGNTETVIGVFDRDAPIGSEPVEHWRLGTQIKRTADELALLLRSFLRFYRWDLPDVDAIAISSGVPEVTAALRLMCRRYSSVAPVVVEPGVKTGMPILYDNPKEVGADRIANAVGAHDRYGGPTIVVDFGTATTFDAISGKGEYLGGAIIPGIEIGLDALFSRTAGLRRVELLEPRNVIGKTTVESIQSGVIYGTAAQVDGLCRLMQVEMGESTVVATGGLCRLVAPLSSSIQHEDPWLTLHGLRLVFERNAPVGAG